MTDPNRLIDVQCPACGVKNKTGGEYFCKICGQAIFPGRHAESLMESRNKEMMKRITASRSRAFLTALANIKGMPNHLPLHPPEPWMMIPGGSYKEVGGRNNYADAERFLKAFSKFFPPDIPKGPGRETYLVKLLMARNYLRLAWGTSEVSTRVWGIHNLRRFARQLTIHPDVEAKTLERVLELQEPPKDAIQQALVYFELRAASARPCRNPNCPEDLFFFAEKPNQKFCSDTCAETARSAAKKEWWKLHGSAWRKRGHL